ncbi:hemicentin-1-like isoform X2 [Lytechinus pictus]|uniref:hemicentin-1-like isoform X2 n=1 Tax=Lytechinus pictus TaxID=7653 RepID=UPI0030B9E080
MGLYIASELVLVIILIVNDRQAQGVLQFTQAPSNQAVLLNQALWWHCIARASIGSQEPTYSWVRGSQMVIGGSEGVAVFSNGTLYIETVTQELLGSYRCRVQSGVQRIESDEVTLALASLGISFTASPNSVTQNLGSSLALHCSIASIPMATITWQLNGDDISMTTDINTSEVGGVTTSELEVNELDHQYGGNYRCLATNHLLIGLTRYSQLGEVTLIGRPGFSTTPEPITVVLGGTATFLCEVNGSPASTVDWLNPQDTVISTGGRFTATSSRLTITNTQQSDSGYFTCRATNAWGENTASALLTVTDPTQEIIFTMVPIDQSVVVGGRVTFPCSATGSPTPTIEWRKELSDLPTDRIQEPAVGWLRITGIEVTDSGFYVCTASNSITTVSTRVQLIVQVAPNFTVLPEDTIVETGGAVLLDCEADGMPTPAIKWNTPLPELGVLSVASGLQFGVEVFSNGSLAIPYVENRHAGTYVCLASNTVSSSSTATSLTVRSSPVITSSPIDQTAIEGELARFECRAAATPTPVISWLFNGQLLLTDIKFEVLGNGDLRINNVEEDQEGVYTCSAGNELGVRNVSAYLTVYLPPQFVVHPVDITVDPGSKVRLDCEASGDPMPSIQWQKDGSPLVLETNIEVLSNSSIVIDGLLETNTGEYTCIATNAAGSIQVTATLSTPDVPKFTTAPSNTTGNESYPISIRCRADARETPIISWYLSDADGNQGDRIGLGINPPATRASLSFVSVNGDLELNQVTKRDEGWYLCLAENSAGSISEVAFLSVNVPPRVTSTNTPVSAMEGSDYTLLSCEIEGQPTPDITWFLPSDGPVPTDATSYTSSIQGNTAYLVVYSPNVSHHDGDFVCVLSNFLGSANATVRVTVQGGPVLTAVEAFRSGLNSITLRCQTKGAPTPTTTWQMGTTPLPHPSVTGHSVSPDWSLVITGQSVGVDDVYSCVATNRYGSVTATLQVPGQVATPTISDITSTSLNLSWATPTPTSDLPITAYNVQYQAESSNEYSLAGETGDPFYTVEGLQPYTGYWFRVQAVNGLGVGPFSPATSLVSTAQGAPSRPRSVEVAAVGNVITVTWSAPSRLNGNTDDIIYEVLTYPLENESDITMVTVSHNANEFGALIDSLEYVMDYEVKVRAGNSALREWSPYVTAQITTGYQAPTSAVENFSAKANSSSSIWLVWQPIIDETFEAYLISFRILNSSDMAPDVALTAREASSYLIIGLPSGTPHGVRMAYQNAGGLSPFTREIIVTTLSDETTADRLQGGGINGGIIAAIVCGILAVLLILALLSFGMLYWKRKNDDWSGQSHFNVDSLWINRRGGSQKGVYDLSMVNENFSPDETGMSSDSAYDLGGAGGGRRGDSLEVSPRSEASEGDEKGKKKKRRWKGFPDVIYKNPDNPGVVLVSQAVIGDVSPPPVQVNKEEVLSEDEAEQSEPRPLSLAEDSLPLSFDSTFDRSVGVEENIYVEVGEAAAESPPLNTNPHGNEGDSRGLSPEFPVFPNADDSVKLSDDLHVDRKLMRKMERKAEREQEKKARKKEREEERRKQKETEREEKERDKMFGGGRRMSGGIGKIFKKKKSDEIPYPETNFGITTERQVENAGMF